MIIPCFVLNRKNSFHRHMIVTIICAAADGWAARATKTGVNSYKWIGEGKRIQKSPCVSVFVGNTGVLAVWGHYWGEGDLVAFCLIPK